MNIFKNSLEPILFIDTDFSINDFKLLKQLKNNRLLNI
jgi:hypothetical protein